MHEIKVFVSDDGIKFDTVEECMKYETAIKDIEKLMEKLPSIPTDPLDPFFCGLGWIEHDKQTFNAVWNEFHAIVCKYLPFIESNDFKLDSSAFKCALIDTRFNFYNYFQRYLNTVVDNYREYGGIFYAQHPDKVGGTCLNPKK